MEAPWAAFCSGTVEGRKEMYIAHNCPTVFCTFTLAHLVVFCFVVFGVFLGGGGETVGPGELLRITPPPLPPPVIASVSYWW